MAGKKNPNLGDKLRQEREGAENTLRDSRNKAADSSMGDSSKKKAEHRRQIRHEADLAKMRSKKLKSEQEVKAKKNAAASGKKGGKPKKPGNLAADALSAKAHQSVRNADQDNNSGVEAAHFTEGSAEGAARAGSRFQYGRKLRQYKKLERLEKKANVRLIIVQAPPAQFATKKRSQSRLLESTLFQKVALMFQRVQIVSKCGQVCYLQRNQIDVGGHRTGDLLGCITILIDEAKDFIAVHQDFCCYDIGLIFRLGFHVIEHELMNRGGFRHIPVKLVMS